MVNYRVRMTPSLQVCHEKHVMGVHTGDMMQCETAGTKALAQQEVYTRFSHIMIGIRTLENIQVCWLPVKRSPY